jgi:hypothetical protein
LCKDLEEVKKRPNWLREECVEGTASIKAPEWKRFWCALGMRAERQGDEVRR